MEYKAWWVADLVDRLAALAGTCHRFGILSNWQRAWFLRRAETAYRKTLEYFVIELDEQNPPISMLKAWVGMVLLAEDYWFYTCTSPTPSDPPPARYFGDTATAWRERV